MKKHLSLFAATALIMLLVSVRAHAQGGCDDSPENPTLILAGLAAGTYGVSALRRRFATRRHGSR